MYCKYCGKPLSDGARFCGFCGKDQSERCINNMLRVVSYSTNISKQFICAISSFIINCAIILLCLTDLFNLKVNIGDLYSDSTHFGVLDLFENTDMLNAFSYISTDVQQVSDSLESIGSVTPTVSSIIIYILGAIQFVINRFLHLK